MDSTDKRLLALLQEDASKTNASLAESVGLSPSSCLRRIRRLKKSGVIDRVVAILSPAKAGRSLKAIVTVELEKHGEQFTADFLKRVAKEPAVIQAYSVSGATDAIIMLRLIDMEEYDAVSEKLFHGNSNVARFYTMFAIKTAKEVTSIPI